MLSCWKRNVSVAKHSVGDRVARSKAPTVKSLERGEGRIVRDDGDAIGAYRDAEGYVHGVSATCTHLGCTVQWNDAETSWDCPCHGSRLTSMAQFWRVRRPILCSESKSRAEDTEPPAAVATWG